MFWSYWAADMPCAYTKTWCIKARWGHTSSYRTGLSTNYPNFNFHNKTHVFIYHGFFSYITKHFADVDFSFPSNAIKSQSYLIWNGSSVCDVCSPSFWRNMVLFGGFSCGKNVISQALSKVVSWLLCCHGCGKIFIYSIFLVPSLYCLSSLKMLAVLQFWSSGLCGIWGKRKCDVWCSHMWISPNWQWHCLTWCEQWGRLNSMASSPWSLSYSRWVGGNKEEEGVVRLIWRHGRRTWWCVRWKRYSSCPRPPRTTGTTEVASALS